MKGDSEMDKKKWPPIDPGTAVMTTQPNLEKRDEWTDAGWERRKWGVRGIIITHHDSHGLCYDVRHEDGTEGCYNPEELEVLALTHRKLVIKEARRQSDGVTDVTFYESCACFLMGAVWLREKGVNPEELTPGRSILIQGKGGNEDVLLARPDALEDIILVPLS